MDASCSEPSATGLLNYIWDLGDGRERDTRVITPIYNTPGIYTATLLVRPTSGPGEDRTQKDVTVVAVTTTSVPGGGGPTSSSTSSTTTSIGPPVDLGVTMTASGSGGSWTYTVTVTNAAGFQTDPSVSLNFQSFAGNGTPATLSAGGCSSVGPGAIRCILGPMASPSSRVVSVSATFTTGLGLTFTNIATVGGGGTDSNPGNNMATLATNVPLRIPDTSLDTSFSSVLSLSHGEVAGQVVVNGTHIYVVDSSGSFTHPVRGKAGENQVEGMLASETGHGAWRLDFSGTPHFEAGTFVVDSGEVLSLDATSIVFRVTGNGGRIKFRFRLRP